jgi:hypothetical protein
LRLKGGIHLELGAGDSSVGLGQNLIIDGGIEASAAAPGSTIGFYLQANTARINGDVLLDLHAATTGIFLQGETALAVKGSLRVTGSGGDDSFSLTGDSFSVSKELSLAGGEGENIVYMGTKRFAAGSLAISGGSGHDSVTLTDDVGIKGLASFALGGGTNSVEFSWAHLSAGAVTYTGEGGVDGVNLNNGWLKVRGTADFQLGAGSNTFYLSGSTATLGGKLSVLSLNDGADTFQSTVRFDSAVFRGGVDVRGAVGSSQTLTFQINTSLQLQGGFYYGGGPGSDTVLVTVGGGKLSGSIDVNTGWGTNEVQLNLGESRIAAPITLKGGTGADHFRIYGTGTVFSAPVVLDGQAGDNVLNVDGSTTRFSFLKSLKIISDGAATDKVDVHLARLRSGLEVQLGAGASEVRINDVHIRGATLIETGDGNDQVSIERDFGRVHSVLAGPVTIRLGDGTDLAYLGGGTLSSIVEILAQVIVDGGAGPDTVNDIEADNQLGPLGAVSLIDIP